MALASILSEMPDLLRRTLEEHTPDAQGYCRECRDATGVSATWPCVTRELAEEAQHIYGGGLPGTRDTGRAPVGQAPRPDRQDSEPSVAGRRRARDLSGVTDS
ncbi:hypothetical protein, partial [Pseudonocardia sp. KRD291]|uniref:hypothetical protein n=1 Tax=Pseudonocardia sp. KRD291 TaxID=2792007 RepID=UPI001C4A2F78